MATKIKQTKQLLRKNILVIIFIALVVIGSFVFFTSRAPYDTSDWKTYTDAQNGYSIKYYPSWEQNEYGFRHSENGKVDNAIVFVVVDKPIEAIYDGWMHPALPSEKRSNMKVTREKIDGKDVIKVASTSTIRDSSIDSYDILIGIKPNKTILLSSQQHNKDLLNSMVDTFTIENN